MAADGTQILPSAAASVLTKAEARRWGEHGTSNMGGLSGRALGACNCAKLAPSADLKISNRPSEKLNARKRQVGIGLGCRCVDGGKGRGLFLFRRKEARPQSQDRNGAQPRALGGRCLGESFCSIQKSVMTK